MRSITHLDADAFFASVEQAADPRLRGKPVAVGGEKRGIIASASYEARKFGIYTPMPTARARKLCPKLILLPGDFEKYERFSQWMFSYAYDFTPEVEISSIDEGYFDLSGARKSPVEIADTIRTAIRQSLKITVSEGIGSNKLVSQIASKLNKPAAFCHVPAGREVPFLHPLPNRWLPGVGPKTSERMNAAGLTRIHQVAAMPTELLGLLVGRVAPQMKNFANGVDERPVIPVREPAKSYSQQETFDEDQTDEEFIEATLRRMADHLFAKVREDGKSVRTLMVKVRYNDMAEDQCSESLHEPTDLETDIYSRLRVLLRQGWKRRVSLRLVSLKLSNLYEGFFRAELPLEASARQHEAHRRLAATIDDLRRVHGPRAILRGHDFVLARGREVVPNVPDRTTVIQASTAGVQTGETASKVSPRSRLTVRTSPGEIRDARASVPPGGSGTAIGARTPLPRVDKAANQQGKGATTVNSDQVACNYPKHQSTDSILQETSRNQVESNDGDRSQRSFSVQAFAAPGRVKIELQARLPAEPPAAETSLTHPLIDSPTRRSRSDAVLREAASAEVARQWGKTKSARRVTLAATSMSIPLHVHSFYSFLDSTLSIDAIIDLAKRYELPAIALTDKGNLHGAVEFVQAAKAAGIKPILGAEVEWEGQSHQLYVQNATGYTNLCRMLSQCDRSADDSSARTAAPQGRKKVRTHDEEDENPGRAAEAGVGILSPLRGLAVHDASTQGLRPGLFPSAPPKLDSPGLGDGFATLAKRFDGFTDGLLAVGADARLADLFPGRFYLEISNAEALRKLDGATKLPLVAALPIHYATPADRWKFDVVQSIRTRTLLRQEHLEKRLTGEFHFRTPHEMQEMFREHPELLAHSVELAERCAFEMPFGKPQFPPFVPPDGSAPHAFLRKLVLQGLHDRYGQSPIANRRFQISNLKSQIETELSIIAEVGYEEYFLVVWDILQECRRCGIEWITRGSAADSLVCYCLRISDVCPVRFDLYFRRFLNLERMALNKLPDIDVDFPHDRKDDVIDLIFAKYGTAHTAVVGGFSTYQARSALGDVAKVLGVSEYQIRRVTEHLPWAGASELKEALAWSQECRDLPLNQEPYSTALQMAEFLDGFPRHPKMHPCGLVMSRQPMMELTPCFISNKGYPTTHFDMEAVEAIGLVKMDILAQGGLGVMRDVKGMLAERGVEVDTDRLRAKHFVADDVKRPVEGAGGKVGEWESGQRRGVGVGDGTETADEETEPWTDPEVWEMLANGGGRAVHHIESPAMIGLCRQCNVRDIDTLIAIVSVIRPGAANESKKMEFTRRYQGLLPVTYPHPSLEPCLKSTFGLVVYEEHILQICETFAGLPAGRADILRRALGKAKADVIAGIQKEFFTCAQVLGRADKDIADVWNLVIGFKGYAFCKAHSTAYGVEAYQSAWLKRYFPAEFMAAVLTNGKGFYRPLVYVLECHRLGIPLLPPWVNEPGPHFMVKAEGRRQNEATKCEGTKRTDFHSAFCILPSAFPQAIRVPVTYVKGLTERTKVKILQERQRGEFASLGDFYRRVMPLPEEMEALIRVGALDGFGASRTKQFWEFQVLAHSFGDAREPNQGWLFSRNAEGRWQNEEMKSERTERADSNSAFCMPHSSFSLSEPSRRQLLEWEAEWLGFPASRHPLELYDDIAWETYCPVNRLGEHVGETVVTCGLVIEDRIHHQVTGEPMKFLTLADWTGMIETELFAQTYRSYGLATVRHPVLEITAKVEPYENGRGHSLRVLRAGKPRKRAKDRAESFAREINNF